MRTDGFETNQPFAKGSKSDNTDIDIRTGTIRN